MAHREVGESEISPILNPPQPTITGQSHLNGNEFPEEVIIFLHSMVMWFFTLKKCWWNSKGDICYTFWWNHRKIIWKSMEVESCKVFSHRIQSLFFFFLAVGRHILWGAWWSCHVGGCHVWWNSWEGIPCTICSSSTEAPWRWCNLENAPPSITRSCCSACNSGPAGMSLDSRGQYLLYFFEYWFSLLFTCRMMNTLLRYKLIGKRKWGPWKKKKQLGRQHWKNRGKRTKNRRENWRRNRWHCNFLLIFRCQSSFLTCGIQFALGMMFLCCSILCWNLWADSHVLYDDGFFDFLLLLVFCFPRIC